VIKPKPPILGSSPLHPVKPFRFFRFEVVFLWVLSGVVCGVWGVFGGVPFSPTPPPPFLVVSRFLVSSSMSFLRLLCPPQKALALCSPSHFRLSSFVFCSSCPQPPKLNFSTAPFPPFVSFYPHWSFSIGTDNILLRVNQSSTPLYGRTSL